MPSIQLSQCRLSALVVITASLLSGCEKHYETVKAIPFADDNFRACVLEADEVYSEDITTLDCDNRGINSAAELMYFENLRHLSLDDNSLETVDLSNNPNLRTINLADNELESLDLANQHDLKTLNVNQNDLNELDVSNSTKLEKLMAADNQLEALMLGKNKRLTQLAVQNNDLTSLDVSTTPNLTLLNVMRNSLTTLDLSHLTKLKTLVEHGNPMRDGKQRPASEWAQ